MKKKRISTYITLLTLLSSMLLYSPTLAAQEKKTTIEEEKVPFYQGTTIGVDIFGLGPTLLMTVPIYIIKPQLLISA